MNKEITVNGEVYVMKAYLDRKKVNHEDLEAMLEPWLSEEEREETGSNMDIIAGELDKVINEVSQEEVKEKLQAILAMVVNVQMQMDGLNDIAPVV